MNLKLYNKSPFALLSDLDREFEDFWKAKRDKQGSFPACDFHEDKDHYFLSLDLPGLSKKNLKIHYENQILTVSGERKEEYKKESQESHSHFSEKFYGFFSRSFKIPSQLNQNKIEAQFSEGVLELVLPKATESKGKEIEVKEGKKTLFSTLNKKVS